VVVAEGGTITTKDTTTNTALVVVQQRREWSHNRKIKKQKNRENGKIKNPKVSKFWRVNRKSVDMKSEKSSEIKPAKLSEKGGKRISRLVYTEKRPEIQSEMIGKLQFNEPKVQNGINIKSLRWKIPLRKKKNRQIKTTKFRVRILTNSIISDRNLTLKIAFKPEIQLSSRARIIQKLDGRLGYGIYYLPNLNLNFPIWTKTALNVMCQLQKRFPRRIRPKIRTRQIVSLTHEFASTVL